MTSTAFQSWFGNSSVVNADGTPRIVFHGTAIQGTTFDARPGELPVGAFVEFDQTLLGQVTESSDAKAGFWFSACEHRACDAAREAQTILGGSSYVYEVFLRLQRPLVLKNVCDYDPADVLDLATEARAAGHDGLIFEEGEYGPPDFLVFDPTSIKSVLNSGDFNPTDPDITDRLARASRALVVAAASRSSGKVRP